MSTVGEGPWSWRVGADPDAVHEFLCASDAHHATLYDLPVPSRNPAKTRQLVESGAVQVLMHGTEMVAMFTLTDDPPADQDISVFPPALRPAYLQRLCVDPRRLARSPAAGLRCLRHAAELARARGADVLRAEANPDLLATAALLTAFGFVQHGATESASQLRRVRLQKELAARTTAARTMAARGPDPAPGGRERGMPPEVMIRQVESLAADLRALAGPVLAQVRDVLGSPWWRESDGVYLIGAGDSHHAGRAAAMAFQTIAGVPCSVVSAQSFADYGGPGLRLRPGSRHPGSLHPGSLHPGRPVVIAASASGGTPEVIAALDSARVHGARTVVVTGRADSPAARAADHSIVVALPDQEPSPGIRSYQATLLGLLAVAVELPAGGREGDAAELGAEIAALADHIEATALAIKDRCRDVADVVARSPVTMFLGSGPSMGSALFSAAKMAEAAAITAIAQDMGEWWHVERWASPADMPVFVIAPPGPGYPRAVRIAQVARELGRRVVAVVADGDAGVAGHADMVLGVRGQVREEFSPLLYHIFAGYTASFAAARLGRRPFARVPVDAPQTEAPRPRRTAADVSRLVTDIVLRHLPPEGATALAPSLSTLSLSALGLSSLGLAGLIVDLEREFSVAFPEDMLVPETFGTLRSVTDAIAALMQAS